MDSEKNLKSSTIAEATGLVLPRRADIDTVDGAVQGLAEAAHVYFQLRSYQEQCRRTLREASDRLGQRTFEVAGFKVEVETADAAHKPIYDADALFDGLQAAGCPLERLHALISYEPKVNGTVIRQLSRNPQYLAAIRRATTGGADRPRTVKVSDEQRTRNHGR